MLELRTSQNCVGQDRVSDRISGVSVRPSQNNVRQDRISHRIG